MTQDDDQETPFEADRNRIERTGAWGPAWGPFHRHFCSDAIHRDGGPECDQAGTPRRVYVFDPDTLREHEAIVARWAAGQAAAALRGAAEAVLDRMEPGEVHRDLDGNEEGGVIRVVRCDVIRAAVLAALQPGFPGRPGS